MNSANKTLAELVHELGDRPTALQVAKTLKQLRALDADAAELKPIRLGIVSSFTFDVLTKPLEASGYCDGLRLETYNAPFGQYLQELLDPDSGLYRFGADLLLVAVRLQDACPALYEAFNGMSADDIEQVLNAWKENLVQALSAFRRSSSAPIICTNCEQPAYRSLGLADVRCNPSQTAVIEQANAWLLGLGEQIASLHVMDVDCLAARYGRDRWCDPKLWFWARVPIAADNHWPYAREIARMLRATLGKVRKVLALDCDNTLWGGVLGDVGRDGIQLGHDYPGSAYVALQRRALELQKRGVVLVVASKNDHDAVIDVFEHHSDMVLRPEHVAYFGVNWNPKPDNLRMAAETLNLGLDSFVFVDDHPVECAMMRQLLPQVLTVELPEDPAMFERTLARLDCFDQVAVSAEDRQRGSMYRAEVQRADLRAGTGDLETFYRQLGMRMTVSRNAHSAVGRAAQLTQRTNQFNMTTIRRSESEIAELMADQRFDVYTLHLCDRFGDAGIVGLAILDHGRDDDADVLETFLMSCRVLGRTIEQAFVGWIGRAARRQGKTRLIALFRETRKNLPFAGFYKSLSMRLEGQDDTGAQRWLLDLESDCEVLTIPPWIELAEESA